MDDKKASPFIDPNLTQDDIPDEDLHTLARLAGEYVREQNRKLRAAGLIAPVVHPSTNVLTIKTGRDPSEDGPTR